jgi:hypothetical protein
MPTDPGTPPSPGAPVENAEIISKTMIGALSYTPLTEEGAGAYPVSRTDRGCPWTGAGGRPLRASESRVVGCSSLSAPRPASGVGPGSAEAHTSTMRTGFRPAIVDRSSGRATL